MKKDTYSKLDFVAIGCSAILFITSLIAIFTTAYILDVYHPLWDLLFIYGLIALSISIVVFFVNIFLGYKISEYREKKEIQRIVEKQKQQQAEARKLQAMCDNLIKEKKVSDNTCKS